MHACIYSKNFSPETAGVARSAARPVLLPGGSPLAELLRDYGYPGLSPRRAVRNLFIAAAYSAAVAKGEVNTMQEIAVTIVDEQVSSLENIGIEEGCCSSTTSCSLDISDVEFE